METLPSLHPLSDSRIRLRMLRRRKGGIYEELANSTRMAVYLNIVLWSTFWCPYIHTEEQWERKTLFTSLKMSTSVIRMNYMPLAVFKSTFWTTIAMMGYYYISGDVGNLNKSLEQLESATIGAGRYYWVYYMPWVAYFTARWLQNVAAFCVLLSENEYYETTYYVSATAILMALFSLQAFFASEIICLAYQGWIEMGNLEITNLIWYIKTRVFAASEIHMNQN